MFNFSSGLEVSVFQCLQATGSYDYLQLPFRQPSPIYGSPSTKFPYYQFRAHQKQFALISSTVQPKREAPSSQMGKWATGLTTGHHKLEAKIPCPVF